MPNIETVVRSITQEDCTVARTAYTKLDEYFNDSSNVEALVQLKENIDSLVEQFGEDIVIQAIMHKLIGVT